MHRKAEAQVTLSDGTTLPKGSRIMILNDILKDPTIFSEPDKFDAYRFYNKRKLPGEENKHQFTTTAEDALSFGHGKILRWPQMGFCSANEFNRSTRLSWTLLRFERDQDYSLSALAAV